MDETPPVNAPTAGGRAKPSQDPESSTELLARARTGDSAALNELCARYLPRLQRWAHGRLPSWARGALDTHDLVQDTLAQVIKRIHAFEPRHDAAFQAYLRQALLNRLRDELRKAERHPTGDPLSGDSVSPDPSPLEQAIGRQALERYEAALQRLQPDDRDAIILRIELGCTHAEVGEALGKTSAAAARMTVSRALVRLSAEMSRSATSR